MRDSLQLMSEHHKNVMEHLEASYGHETKLQTHVAGLQEKSKVGSHARNLEMVGAIQKAAEGGTAIAHNFPEGGGVSYTRKQQKVKAPKPSATPNFPSVKTPEEPQMEAPVATVAQPKKTQKYAHRDPVTRKISGYKDYPQDPKELKAKPKKAAPRKRK